jgi:hypothetical protein
MRQALARRIERLGRSCDARRRSHYLFRYEGETAADVQARINAMVASGEARRSDQFVIFSWKYSADDDAAVG